MPSSSSQPSSQTSHGSAETFSALLALIQQGNSGAELQLVRQFHKGLYYAMRHRIGNDTLAEDVCQETWRILLEKFRAQGAAAVKDVMALPAYIHSTALNVYLAEQRRHLRRHTETDSDLLLEVADEESGNFVDQLATSRIQKRVREVIDGMSNARDKLVLYRYYIQEQSKEQICRDLGLDHRHFDRVAHRARERLRKAVEETAGDLQQDLQADSPQRNSKAMHGNALGSIGKTASQAGTESEADALDGGKQAINKGR